MNPKTSPGRDKPPFFTTLWGDIHAPCSFRRSLAIVSYPFELPLPAEGSAQHWMKGQNGVEHAVSFTRSLPWMEAAWKYRLRPLVVHFGHHRACLNSSIMWEGRAGTANSSINARRPPAHTNEERSSRGVESLHFTWHSSHRRTRQSSTSHTR